MSGDDAGGGATGTLLVDARPIGHPTARQRGIGRYVTGFLRGLAAIDAPVIALFDDDADAESLSEAIPGLTVARWNRDVVRQHAAPGTWFIATQLMLHPIPLDPIPRVVTEARLPVAAVMYDVIPYRFPERYHVEADARNQSVIRASLARTTDSMLAISQFSAATASAELRYPIDRIGVIGAGVEPQFQPLAVARHPRPDRVLPPEVDRYVVAVTGGDDRKNTEGLIAAWGLVDVSLRSSHHLVIACAASPATLQRWRRYAVDSGVAPSVLFTGSLDDDEMVAIHQWARLSVMPSFEEGFGLPVLEAAASGVPAICSNVTSLPEVLDEPAACFDPNDHAAMARAIGRALADHDHRRALLVAGERAAKRWTWANVARDTIDFLSEQGPRWPLRVAIPRHRLALAGPFAGSESGIGAYDESVYEALRRVKGEDGTSGTDTIALVDSSGASAPTGSSKTDERLPVRAAGRFFKPWDVDHIVAALGSSPHHVSTADLVSKVPCHVWLHETSLVGLHVGLAHASGSERWAMDHVRSVIDTSESSALAASIDDSDLLDAERLHQLGVTMLAPVLEAARSVIVSSEQAASTLRALRPVGPPILVVPLAFPSSAPSVSLPTTREIVAVGWLAPNKDPMLALEVLARLSALDDVTLTFVGPGLDRTVDEVRDAADRMRLTDRVTISGRLDDEDYRRRITSARLGLQLRLGDRGEMSAAVVDLVAAGVPTVTTLTTAGASSAGLRVVGHDVDALVAAIEPLLADDDAWIEASQDALARAAGWTFDDVARELLRWVAEVGDLDPTTIRSVGPLLASPAPHD